MKRKPETVSTIDCTGCKWKGNDRVCNACKKTDPRTALPSPHMECPTRHEPVAAKKSARPDTPCRIAIHSRTNRLSDPDGRSCKALLDGLTKAGILRDDSARFVKEVTQSQTVTEGDEETEVIIKW